MQIAKILSFKKQHQWDQQQQQRSHVINPKLKRTINKYLIVALIIQIAE